MTYEESIARLKGLLETHNAAMVAAGDKDDVVDIATTMKALRKAGGTSVEGLAALTLEDFKTAGFPIGVARQAIVAPAAPAPVTGAPVVQRLLMVNERDEAAKLNNAALLAQYDYATPGVIGEVLDERAKGRAFLLFDKGTLCRAESAAYLDALVAGRRVVAMPEIGGRPVEPIRVGQKLAEEVETENPLYPGEALAQPGDVCERTNESWKGIDAVVRLLLWMAVSVTGEIARGLSPETARAIIERARREGAEAAIRRSYPRASVALDKQPDNERHVLTLRASEARRGGPFPPGGELEQPPAVPVASDIPESFWTHPRWIALKDAIIDAFPTWDDLAKMVRFGLGERLEAIVQRGNLNTVVFSLVDDWARPRGRRGELLTAALAANPTHPGLLALAAQTAQAAPPPASGFRALSREALDEIRATATKIGLSDSRLALMGGIDAAFVSSLPVTAAPAAQVMMDLDALNRVPRLSDGSVPLWLWLSKAVSLSRSRSECAVFRRHLAASGYQAPPASSLFT
jgi:hypothetical protein